MVTAIHGGSLMHDDMTPHELYIGRSQRRSMLRKHSIPSRKAYRRGRIP
jgi:hypothetical protein